METGTILELINQLAAYRPHVYFGGGEPFTRGDFLTILAHAKSVALPLSLTTNGTLLDQPKIEKLTELGIDDINVSIDGPEALHDKRRGQGTFTKAMSNMQCLLECKKRKGRQRPFITVNITVNPLVVGHLKETIDTIREATGNEIDFFRIHHLWFVTPSELEAHKAEVHETLGSSAPGAESHCIPLPQLHDLGVLSEEIARLKGTDKMQFFPNIYGKEIHEFYSDGYRLTKRCRAPFRAVLVKPNGDVRFCPDEWIDDYGLGNVREDRFATIWNNQKARHFRSVIFRKGAFPACNRCSWMHCF